MKPRTVSAAGSEFERVQRRFDRWRKTRKRCTPIPDTLWSSAVELAREHGLHRTARTLRLNYYSLKKRLRLVPSAPGRLRGKRRLSNSFRPEPQVIPPAPSRWKMRKVER